MGKLAPVLRALAVASRGRDGEQLPVEAGVVSTLVLPEWNLSTLMLVCWLSRLCCTLSGDSPHRARNILHQLVLKGIGGGMKLWAARRVHDTQGLSAPARRGQETLVDVIDGAVDTQKLLALVAPKDSRSLLRSPS